jgi:hypothetical protein
MASHFLEPQLHLISSSNFYSLGHCFLIYYTSIDQAYEFAEDFHYPTVKTSPLNHSSLSYKCVFACGVDKKKREKTVINSFLVGCGLRN